jgi:hypothetical protein
MFASSSLVIECITETLVAQYLYRWPAELLFFMTFRSYLGQISFMPSTYIS